jgi:heme/copper-type cytochrome/quinol oxidase subunit 2
MQVRGRSSFWFLLPIIFNIIGGIIAYFVIKEDDPKKAKNCLYLGLILAAIPVLLIVVPILVGITLIPHVVPPASQNTHYV